MCCPMSHGTYGCNILPIGRLAEFALSIYILRLPSCQLSLSIDHSTLWTQLIYCFLIRQVVDLLLKSNADVNSADATGTTPLHDACISRSLDVIAIVSNLSP